MEKHWFELGVVIVVIRNLQVFKEVPPVNQEALNHIWYEQFYLKMESFNQKKW